METRNPNVAWVTGVEKKNYVFRAQPVDIHADPEAVWALVKDLSRYSELTAGALSLELHGELKPGATIDVTLQSKEDEKASVEPTAIVTDVDEESKVLGWKRPLPHSKHHMYRYHVLQPLPPDQEVVREGVRSDLGVYIPSPYGFFVNPEQRARIEKALTDLNNCFKREAEKTLSL